MAEEKMMRLSQVARKLNIGKDTIVEFLAKKGHEVENNPNAKVNGEQFHLLAREFASSAMDKEEASSLTIGRKENKNVVVETDGPENDDDDSLSSPKEEEEIRIKSTAAPEAPAKKKEAEPAAPQEAPKAAPVPEQPKAEEKPKEEEHRLKGVKVLGKIDLDSISGKKPAKKETPKAEVPKPEAKAPDAPAPKQKEAPVAPKAQQEKEEVKAVEKPAEQPKEKAAETPAEQPKAPVAKEEAPAKAAQEEKGEKETPKSTPAKPAPKQEEKAKTPDQPKKKEPEATPKAAANAEQAVTEEDKTDTIKAKADNLKGLTVLGKIELPAERRRGSKPVASSDDKGKKKKQKRKRITNQPAGSGQQGGGQAAGARNTGANRPVKPAQGGRGAAQRGPAGGAAPKRGARVQKEEPTDKEIQEQIKETLARLSGNRGSKFASRTKHRRDKRSAAAEAEEERRMQAQEDAKLLRVTEYISANDLASLMNVSVNEIIAACMSLGMFVSINQRLDAEAITVIADEFGYSVDFTSTEDEAEVVVEKDAEEDLKDRAPIVTIMGHVDHGKTSLLDYIRSAKVAAGEAGGITQHIGAYDVTTESGKRISFLDTPGHEAFTAMRARGAKVTDVVIIVVAADDAVMPQTKEALNHAQVAGVPIVIAINKIDRPSANPEKIKEELANMNILVEDWGGKYQCQEISAKTGQGVEELLEKVLLEAELLELKANPDKAAQGTVIEASLDKGRGYVSTLLVQAGTMRVGDIVLAGQHHGRVKAMFDHRGNRLKEAGPSTPVQMLGLGGAPQAGDKFNVMETEREAREISTKREQILREQSMRTKKHVTLDEIGRRLAIGNFKELNVIVKGDVDGSVEALSDSLLKLSTEEIQVNIIHKGVGQISESDILLATASDAIVVGFQVRPSSSARKLAENEEIEIRLYSIIYDAINEVKAAMEGMLAPEFEEIITGNIQVREVFKISKVGTVAGCYVTDGFVKRNNQIRLIRDGIVVYTGEIDALKRFKDDVSEVKQNYECGISIKNYNDIQIGDVIEGFTQQEIKRKL